MSVFILHNYQKELKSLKENLLENLTVGVDKIEDYKYILGKIHMLEHANRNFLACWNKRRKLDD